MIGIVAAILMLAGASRGQAQRVGFGLFSNHNLTLTSVGPAELDFGIVLSGQPNPVNILLTDPEVVVIEIEGVAYLDVTVTITPPENNRIALEGIPGNFYDNSKSMPVSIHMAYSNSGAQDASAALAQAMVVAGNQVTFPVRRRLSGPPGPPPTPPHAGYTPPTAKAYIFIYGSLTVGNVNAGPYSGEIEIHAEYSTYN